MHFFFFFFFFFFSFFSFLFSLFIARPSSDGFSRSFADECIAHTLHILRNPRNPPDFAVCLEMLAV